MFAVSAEYILPCYKSDPEINKCLRNTFNHLRPYLKSGISDIDVPSIDPLKINTLIMENGRGALRVKASFYNITTTGASNYSIGNIRYILYNNLEAFKEIFMKIVKLFLIKMIQL
nr:unnamed protein product [Callosobruchus analis]